MKYKILISSVFLLSITTNSQAADIIYHTPDVPVYDEALIWGGAYIGAQIGYDWLKNRLYRYDQNYDEDFSTTANGFMGGLYAGYNWEFSNAYLFGVEGDINYTRLQSSWDTVYQNVDREWNSRVKWEGAIRARIGMNYARILPYIAGGVAFAGVKNDFTNVPYNGDDDGKSTHIGYTIGAGVDYALSNNLILRAEYRYSDYGKKSVLSDNVENKFTTNNIRLGLAYKF